MKVIDYLDRLEKSAVSKWISFLFVSIFITLLVTGSVKGQTTEAGLSVTPGVFAVGQGESVTLSIALDSASAAYYYETEVSFDAQQLDFTGLDAGALLGGSNGIVVGDLLDDNTTGVSASRTSGEGVGPGILMHVRFSVDAVADTGLTRITFNNSILKDGVGNSIPVIEVPDLTLQIKPRLTEGGLLSGSRTIHEAEKVRLKTFAFAHQVTNVSSPSDELTVWLGLNDQNTDPSKWTADKWIRAKLTGTTQDGYNLYEATFGPALTVGNWYYASRFQLNNNPYKYGGFAADTGDFWDGVDATAGLLTVNERPPYRFRLADWDFDDRNLKVDQSLQTNASVELRAVGSGVEGYDTKDGGYVLATDHWHVEQGADSLKYLKTVFSTAGFEQIGVSALFRGTSSAARDFQLQFSLDDSVWTDVTGGLIQVAENWPTSPMEMISLPVAVNNTATVYLRWLRIGDMRVDGTTGISTQGKVRIDDLQITGLAVNPTHPTVWPGDADNDGQVSVSDVLPLGTWWGVEGPDRILRKVSWSGLQAIGWFPFEATFADTDGTGIVDQSDLEAIGLNFGNAWQTTATYLKERQPPELQLPALQKDEVRHIAIHSSQPVALTGVAASLTWSTDDEADPQQRLLQIEPVADSADWWHESRQQNELLVFDRNSNRQWQGARVIKGGKPASRTDRLMRFKVRALTNIASPITFRAQEVHISRLQQSSRQLSDITLNHATATNIGDETSRNTALPSSTSLLQNYPNPFNPTTMLQYQLAEPERVTLTVYTVLGRQIARIVDNKMQQPGRYRYNWDASNYSSGIYFYVLETGRHRFSGKMLLMK